MHDAIIVLGAQVKPDGASEALRRRLQLAFDRYQQNPVLIVCCGAQGHDEPMAEGAFMREWLLEKGVPDQDIAAECASFDTIQNLRNAKVILDAQGLTRPLIITSDYHIPRACAIARHLGMRATGAGSPSVRRYWLKNHLRETLAWGKYCAWVVLGKLVKR